MASDRGQGTPLSSISVHRLTRGLTRADHPVNIAGLPVSAAWRLNQQVSSITTTEDRTNGNSKERRLAEAAQLRRG